MSEVEQSIESIKKICLDESMPKDYDNLKRLISSNIFRIKAKLLSDIVREKPEDTIELFKGIINDLSLRIPSSAGLNDTFEEKKQDPEIQAYEEMVDYLKDLVDKLKNLKNNESSKEIKDLIEKVFDEELSTKVERKIEGESKKVFPGKFKSFEDLKEESKDEELTTKTQEEEWKEALSQAGLGR